MPAHAVPTKIVWGWQDQPPACWLVGHPGSVTAPANWIFNAHACLGYARCVLGEKLLTQAVLPDAGELKIAETAQSHFKVIFSVRHQPACRVARTEAGSDYSVSPGRG